MRMVEKPDRYKYCGFESVISEVLQLIAEKGPLSRCQIEQAIGREGVIGGLSNGAIGLALLDLIERGQIQPISEWRSPGGWYTLWQVV